NIGRNAQNVPRTTRPLMTNAAEPVVPDVGLVRGILGQKPPSDELDEGRYPGVRALLGFPDQSIQVLQRVGKQVGRLDFSVGIKQCLEPIQENWSRTLLSHGALH